MIETLFAALFAALALLFAPHPVGAARSVAPAPPASSTPHSRTAPHPSAPHTVAPPVVMGPVAPLPYSAPGIYCPVPGEPTLATDDPACQ